uniref:Uncharacterized protein n=1 Tax=Rhizochromulina marina TaxID=1034831 RepID=A0A7S2SQQ3_9STRA
MGMVSGVLPGGACGLLVRWLVVLLVWGGNSEAFSGHRLASRGSGALPGPCRWPLGRVHATEAAKGSHSTAPAIYEPYDVVEYSLTEEEQLSHAGKTRGVASVLEDGRLQPLCVWQAGSTEFVWDEDLTPFDAQGRVVRRLDNVFYSQRLVDGGMGPRNPHGEESEDVFLVEEDLDDDVFVQHRPDREIFW